MKNVYGLTGERCYNSGKNIVLIGMPGSGKTTIGKALAKKLGRNFIDIDDLLEKHAGCTVRELFLQGEEHFRSMESEVVLTLEGEKASVIAAGGGIVKRASNMESLRKNGIIIFIDRPTENIARNLDANSRPLFAKGKGRLEELYAERYELYSRYCDFKVENNGEIMEAVEKISSII